MDMSSAFKEYRANRPSSAFDPETAAFTAGWQGAEAEVRALREALEAARKQIGELEATLDGLTHRRLGSGFLDDVLAPEPPDA